MSVEEDPVLLMMLLLKNSWALSGDLTGSSIKFGTRLYDQNVQLPQVCVRPLGGSQTITETGYNPTIFYKDSVAVGVWVRPSSDSGKSLGSAKNISYQMRREVERIVSGSQLSGSSASQPPFIVIGGRWRNMDRTNTRSPILCDEFLTEISYYRKRS
jgi:hypothetical protein